ncbi:DoxX family protein [Escherichia coli]|uniref:DoxX family protein n=1 Tax=Escherichia coli TaxID=562 RepID=A0A377A8Y6_ECOLX|nr:DoxX family protein [Escherichia coli]
MKKLEDVGVLVARILMPILFITAGWGKITATRVPNNIWKQWASRVLCCRW